MTAFLQEICEQPASLSALADFYRQEANRAQMTALPRPRRLLLAGMGASYHAALYASYALQSVGIAALAVESADLIHFSGGLLADFETLIFVSQSGASAEVAPALERLPASCRLVALTNRPQSPLGRAAAHLLPQIAGEETTVATKTYVNSLACLWLLAQTWAGADAQRSCDTLLRVSDALAEVIAQSQADAQAWIAQFGADRPLIFVGHGPHAATARQSAMMLAEWPKRLALASSIGAFRHGTIELIQPVTAAVIFGLGGSTRESAWALAAQIREQGAQVTLILDGRVRAFEQADAGMAAFGDFLSPLLDVVPMQVFAERLAREGQARPGFRYISKVVTQL